MYMIIIILIVVLLIAAIFINAMQQHRAKADSERRADLAKQRAVIDETKNVILACSNMPISGRMLQILDNRVLGALKTVNELGGTPETKQKLANAEQKSASQNPDSVSANEFVLPDNDKLIIQYIQAVKKLRILLRSEHSKGKVESKVFYDEDKQLERLQMNTHSLVWPHCMNGCQKFKIILKALTHKTERRNKKKSVMNWMSYLRLRKNGNAPVYQHLTLYLW